MWERKKKKKTPRQSNKKKDGFKWAKLDADVMQIPIYSFQQSFTYYLILEQKCKVELGTNRANKQGFRLISAHLQVCQIGFTKFLLWIS